MVIKIIWFSLIYVAELQREGCCSGHTHSPYSKSWLNSAAWPV